MAALRGLEFGVGNTASHYWPEKFRHDQRLERRIEKNGYAKYKDDDDDDNNDNNDNNNCDVYIEKNNLTRV